MYNFMLTSPSRQNVGSSANKTVVKKKKGLQRTEVISKAT